MLSILIRYEQDAIYIRYELYMSCGVINFIYTIQEQEMDEYLECFRMSHF